MKMSPEVGASSPAIMRRSVDLPQPDGPDQHDELAVPNRQLNIAEHARWAVALVELLDPQPRHAGRAPT